MNILTRTIIPVIFATALPCTAAVTFNGLSDKAVRVEVAASTGLEAVYVLPSTQGVTMEFEGASTQAKWSAFSAMGGAYAEEMGTGSSVPCRQGDMGYIVEDNGRQTCFWVIDYSLHQLQLGSITPSQDDSDCSRTVLAFTGNAGEIPYHNINGRRLVLSRELELSWQTLVFDESAFAYATTQAHETLESIGSLVSAPAALCNTVYTLSGDRFLKTWGRELSIESPYVETFAVDAQTRATQASRDADNEIKDSNEGLGGSAPCEITFEAAVSDAAIYTQWEISRDAAFETIDNSFSEHDFTYTFPDQGTTYVRFTANNADGTCPYEGAVYEIVIGESRLDIPNAFSPQASPGTNDEWKVSYKSLTSFECHIFNRWGKELFSTTDPAQGWDGRSGGKYVPAGVYYYVIKATGADGIKYNKAGDINIINYTGSSTTEQPAE